MIVAIDPAEQWDYTCKDDAESAEPTVFTLRGLTAREAQKIEDTTASYDDKTKALSFLTGTKKLLTLKKGLIGVRGLKDKDRADVPFHADPRTGEVSDNFLSRLPDSVRTELAEEIVTRTSLSGDQLGN